MSSDRPLACGILFLSLLPLENSRKPAFHFFQEGLLLRKNAEMMTGICVGCPGPDEALGGGLCPGTIFGVP